MLKKEKLIFLKLLRVLSKMNFMDKYFRLKENVLTKNSVGWD